MEKIITDICYIIGFRAANSERAAALLFVLKKLRSYFPDLEIIVVEQDREPKQLFDEALNVKHFFIYNPGLYNRCWAFNVGVNHTEKAIFAFADSDIFLEKDDYLSCFQATQYFEAITPNRTEAINVCISDITPTGHELLSKRELFTFAGGLLVLTRQGFMKTGGWDERFEGWGCEDEALSHVIYNTVASKSFYLPLYHIDHPRSPSDGKQQGKYEENRGLLEEILSMNGPPLFRYIQYLQNSKQGDEKKYSVFKVKINEGHDILKNLNFVLAVTTYNRLDYLKACINSFIETRNKSTSWQLVIADDGSTDGTKEYLEELKTQHNATIIYNGRTDIHHQVNSILKHLSNLEFDLCFKCDDDIVFKKPGWDLSYWNTIQRTGYQHLVFYDKDWRPTENLDRPITYGNLISNCLPEKIQGAFYTLTKDVLQKIGYFDTQRFGSRGMGHIDYSFRCCRAGFNVIDHPFDVKNSNDFIQLQNSTTYASSLSSKYKALLNPKEIVEQKKKLIQANRTYVPYNENIALSEHAPTFNKSAIKVSGIPKHKKADATFYPERGIAGLFGFISKRIYNIGIDLKLYFIPRSIKSFGKFLNKLGIDLMHIDD